MTEIDKLEGAELAMAVAGALGWERVRQARIFNQPFTDHDTYYLYHNDFFGIDMVRHIGPKCDGDYEPHRSMDQAWELDGEGWLWSTYGYLSDLEAVVGWRTRGGFRSYTSRVLWADFPTKQAAYATARCRAFLKAKEAR